VRRADGLRRVPPSGAVAGVIARTDAARGPWKSPAGLAARLAGCEPEVAVGADASTMLNGYGVCPLRTFAGSGPVVWGARTTAAGSAEWRYIAVRLTALAVLQDVDRGTAWAASEPNGPMLWDALRETVEDYVQALWRDGAFPGWTPEVSYFVRCGEDTASREERAAGTAVVLIGLAIQRAGEFSLLRVPVATADAAAATPPAARVGA
jgi:phage tail sheath protein FI